jgi:hypothetical protein
MGPSNKAVVQRSFGLLELRARTSKSKEAQLARYGPDFAYDEFLAMPNTFVAVSYTLIYMTSFLLFLTFRPVRTVLFALACLVQVSRLVPSSDGSFKSSCPNLEKAPRMSMLDFFLVL